VKIHPLLALVIIVIATVFLYAAYDKWTNYKPANTMVMTDEDNLNMLRESLEKRR